MNKKIELLAKLAGDDWDSALPEDKEFLQRFAHLVILKVFNSIEDQGYEIYELVVDEVLQEFDVVNLEDEDE
jgi:hypothetical protein